MANGLEASVATPGSPAPETTGSDRNAPAMRRRFGGFKGFGGGSLTVRLIFLLVVFLAVPLVLYRLLEAADTDKRDLLLKNVHERGRLVLEDPAAIH